MAKTGIAAIAEGRTDLFRLDPTKIVIREGWNSRDFENPDNIAHVQSLADSIREVGVREPLAGFLEGDHFVLTNGESRLRAVRMLLEEGVEIKTVPVMPEPRHASEADHLASQFIRNSGRPFTPLENAKLFTRLHDLGWSAQEIAEKTGMTPERVNQIAQLNAIPESVKKKIRKGTISATMVQRLQAKSKTGKDLESKVSTAVANAKAEGKTKASPRHASGSSTKKKKKADPKVNYRDLFNELMSYLEAVQTGEKGEGIDVQGVIPDDRWDAMNKSAKIEGRF